MLTLVFISPRAIGNSFFKFASLTAAILMGVVLGFNFLFPSLVRTNQVPVIFLLVSAVLTVVYNRVVDVNKFGAAFVLLMFVIFQAIYTWAKPLMDACKFVQGFIGEKIASVVPPGPLQSLLVDGVVGDYLCERFGDLQSSPLTIEVENNRIRGLHSENKDLRDEFRTYTNTDENSDRVGEFAIGTNTACTHIIGHILQDEKLPGVHIAFGHPYAEHTGANWASKTHIDCVGRDFDIWFDGQQVMREGKFLI